MAKRKAKKKATKKKATKKKAAKKTTRKKATKKAAKKATRKKAAKKATRKKATKKKATKKKATKKKAAKKATRKKATKKKAKKGKSKRKPNAAFMRPLTPSASLAAVVGSKPIPRTEVISKLWAYIRKNKLQESRNIHADDKLKPVFGGKKVVSMFEMMKLISKHLK